MNQISLNRKQIKQLAEILDHFKDIENFKIKEDNSSGIGPSITVSFSLFEKDDTKVNITDVGSW